MQFLKFDNEMDGSMISNKYKHLYIENNFENLLNQSQSDHNSTIKLKEKIFNMINNEESIYRINSS